ncbi:MAG: ribonuclease HII [Candidatus Krumholzibacteriia bacterium]
MPAPRGRLARFDWEASDGGRLVVAGVDEAGRGCLAGPVVAAACVLAPGSALRDLNDSKLLAPPLREELFCKLRAGRALAWAACAVAAPEIDRINILQGSLLAMARCVERLRVRPDLVLVDGNQRPPLTLACRTVVGGDARSAAIAAASIFAKVLRDRIMVAWDRRFPGYGFASNKGYGCPEHRAGLLRLGVCPLHRHSYRPVAMVDQGLLFANDDAAFEAIPAAASDPARPAAGDPARPAADPLPPLPPRG